MPDTYTPPSEGGPKGCCRPPMRYISADLPDREIFIQTADGNSGDSFYCPYCRRYSIVVSAGVNLPLNSDGSSLPILKLPMWQYDSRRARLIRQVKELFNAKSS